MSHETWTQGNDEDELRAVCSCGWSGPWQDRIRAAYEDQAEHHRTTDIDLDPCKECHPELHRAQCWPNARCVAAEESRVNTGDRICHECGQDNPVWYAPNPLWNAVVGGDPTREAGGVLCPTCFCARVQVWLENAT